LAGFLYLPDSLLKIAVESGVGKDLLVVGEIFRVQGFDIFIGIFFPKEMIFVLSELMKMEVTVLGWHRLPSKDRRFLLHQRGSH
jgi:hypothetical protein